MIVGVGFGLRQGCVTIEEHSAGKIVPEKWSRSFVPSAGRQNRATAVMTLERESRFVCFHWTIVLEM